MYKTQIRISDITALKIKYIANEKSRSLNEQLNHIIKEYIKDFERINGKIEIKEKE